MENAGRFQKDFGLLAAGSLPYWRLLTRDADHNMTYSDCCRSKKYGTDGSLPDSNHSSEAFA